MGDFTAEFPTGSKVRMSSEEAHDILNQLWGEPICPTRIEELGVDELRAKAAIVYLWKKEEPSIRAWSFEKEEIKDRVKFRAVDDPFPFLSSLASWRREPDRRYACSECDYATTLNISPCPKCGCEIEQIIVGAEGKW